MAHRLWDPLRDLLDLQERINRLLEGSLARGASPEGRVPSPAWHPTADVCETADEFVVQIELPGVTRDEIDICAEPQSLTVRGQRRAVASCRAETFFAWSAVTDRSSVPSTSPRR